MIMNLLVVGQNFAAVKTLLFFLEEIQQAVCPLTNGTNVQSDVITVFGRAAESKWMPLILCDSGNVNEDIVTRTVGEVEWPFNNQIYDFRWQNYSGRHVGLATVRSHPNESQDALNNKNAAGNEEPLPEIGSMKENDNEEGDVKQVGPIEDFEASAASDERQRAHKHDHQNRY